MVIILGRCVFARGKRLHGPISSIILRKTESPFHGEKKSALECSSCSSRSHSKEQTLPIDTDPGEDIADRPGLALAPSRSDPEVLGLTTDVWPSANHAQLDRQLFRYLGLASVPVAEAVEVPTCPVGAAAPKRLQDRPVGMN